MLCGYIHLLETDLYHRKASKNNEAELVILSDSQPTDWWVRRTVIKQLLAYRCEPADDAQTASYPMQWHRRRGQAEPVYTFSDYTVMLVIFKYLVPNPPNGIGAAGTDADIRTGWTGFLCIARRWNGRWRQDRRGRASSCVDAFGQSPWHKDYPIHSLEWLSSTEVTVIFPVFFQERKR